MRYISFYILFLGFLLLAFGQAVAQKERPLNFLLPSKSQGDLHVAYKYGGETDFFYFIDKHPFMKKGRFRKEDSCTVHIVEFKVTGLGKVEDIRFSPNMPEWSKEAFTTAIKDSERYWIPKRVKGKSVDARVVYLQGRNQSSSSDIFLHQQCERLIEVFFKKAQNSDYYTWKRPDFFKHLYPQYIGYDYFISAWFSRAH